MKHLVYADNAATTQLDTEAFEAMKPFLLYNYGNASQPYSFSRLPRAAIQDARNTIASCINADPSEIIFTSGGTESDNWAIKCILGNSFEKNKIITSSIEHHAILRTCAAMEYTGASVSYLSPTQDGVINENELQRAITPNTRIVSIMMSNNELGTIQPISSLARIAHENNVFFHTDAVQCVGHVPVDVVDLGVDMLSASAHKFNGPKGVGFLYVKKGTPLNAYMNGGGQENNRRAGTENVAGIVGMACALKKNVSNMEQNINHVLKLENKLLNCLKEHGIRYIRNGGCNTIPGLVSMSFPGFSGETILHRLDLLGIMISTGSACDGNETKISHVLKAIGLDDEHARGTIRVSIGKNNTMEDIDLIVAGLCKILVKKEQ